MTKRPLERPFLPASEQPRPYSEIVAERQLYDPTSNAMAEIARLEGEAADATDPDERKRLQCEAEELRCALTHRRKDP